MLAVPDLHVGMGATASADALQEVPHVVALVRLGDIESTNQLTSQLVGEDVEAVAVEVQLASLAVELAARPGSRAAPCSAIYRGEPYSRDPIHAWEVFPAWLTRFITLPLGVIFCTSMGVTTQALSAVIEGASTPTKTVEAPPPAEDLVTGAGSHTTVTEATLPTDGEKQVRPWIRFWARLFDTWSVTLVVGFIVGFVYTRLVT